LRPVGRTHVGVVDRTAGELEVGATEAERFTGRQGAVEDKAKAVPGGPLDGISLDVPGPGYNPSAIIVSTTDAHVLGREQGTDGAASIVAVPYGKGTFIGIGHHVLLYNRPLLERLIATYMPNLIPQTGGGAAVKKPTPTND
jgi:hypothetical protein